MLEGRHESYEEVTIDYAGSTFRTRKINGSLFECPICRGALFYSEKDLIRHIIGHALLSEEQKQKRFFHH